MKINSIIFSPAGNTQKVAQIAASVFDGEKKLFDLLKKPQKAEVTVERSDVTIVSVPVYSGRIPEECFKMLENFKGNNTPAIAIVVYGNRDYDDALLELKTMLENNGFIIIGAAAFIAEHSIFPAVAKNRPDAEDEEKIKDFCLRCKDILSSFTGSYKNNIKVKGKIPYRERMPIPLKPSADSKCNNCGLCAEICPAGAIPKDKPKKTDRKICITCTACIHICPQKARGFNGFLQKILFPVASKKFVEKFGARKEPEVFF